MKANRTHKDVIQQFQTTVEKENVESGWSFVLGVTKPVDLVLEMSDCGNCNDYVLTDHNKEENTSSVSETFCRPRSSSIKEGIRTSNW